MQLCHAERASDAFGWTDGQELPCPSFGAIAFENGATMLASDSHSLVRAALGHSLDHLINSAP